MDTKKVSEVLNIEETENINETILVNAELIDEDLENNNQNKIAFKNDFDFIRKTLRNVVTKGANAIDQIAEVAESSDSPRAYEVMGNLLRITSENSESLMNLHTKRQEFENPKGDNSQNNGGLNITNNTVMVGTSSELQDLLNKAKEDINKIEETSKSVCGHVIMNKTREEKKNGR